VIRFAQFIGLWLLATVTVAGFGAEPFTMNSTEAQGAVSVPNVPAGFYVPKFTVSPDGKYGVIVPRKAWLATHGDLPPNENRLIELSNSRVIGVIEAETGVENAGLGHIHLMPSRWSLDSSLLLWEVDGKFAPWALVLVKLQNGIVRWQLNVLEAAQREALDRTRKAAPEKYAAARSYFEKGNLALNVRMDSEAVFKVSVRVEGDAAGELDKQGKGLPVSLPLKIHAELTSNPKQIDWWPKEAQLDSQLDGIVTEDEKFHVTKFSLRDEPFDDAMGHSWKEITSD
jgi:hypothetical protein